MRLLISILCFSGLLMASTLFAQSPGIQLQLSVQKTYRWEKQHRLRLRQTFLISPDFASLSGSPTTDPSLKEIDYVDPEILSHQTTSNDSEEESEEQEEEEQVGNEEESEEPEEEEDDMDTDSINVNPGNPQAGRNNPTLPENNTLDWQEFLIWRSGTMIQYEYRINKVMRISATYALSLRPGPAVHRTGVDLRTIHRLGGSKLRFENRLRWSQSLRRRESDWRKVQFLRTRVRFRYAIKGSPFVDAELFYRLRKDDSELRLYRLGAGYTFRFGECGRLRMNYQFIGELNRKNPDHSQRIQIEYTYQF
ncbi:MAG: hypothetical protein AAFQ87_03985 [Bacteroidota bacterium]